MTREPQGLGLNRPSAERARRTWFSPVLVACAALLFLVDLSLAAAAPLRVAVSSDLNGSYGSTHYEASVDAAVGRILKLKPDLVISTWDMAAGQRKPLLSRPEVEAMWRGFHAHLSEPLATAGIPLAVTPGNHDGSAYAGFESERPIYAEQWGERKQALRFLNAAHYPFHFFTEVRQSEAASALLLAVNIFLILTAYYVLKPVREALILAGGGAEIKSYAAAGQAVLLLGAVPLYGCIASRVPWRVLINGVTLFFIACLFLFYALALLRVPLGGLLSVGGDLQPDGPGPVLGLRQRPLHAGGRQAAVRHRRLRGFQWGGGGQLP